LTLYFFPFFYCLTKNYTALKNFTLLLVAGLLFVGALDAQTRKGSTEPTPQKGKGQMITRCATMEHLQAYYDANPSAKAEAELRAKYPVPPTAPGFNGSIFRTQSITTIPVVVHVVLSNPTIVTDADVLWFINKLNEDYSGLNPDSTNGTLFYSVRGHSEIRFAMAKRTPSGGYTTGIERISSATGSNANLAVDPIKRASLGGADVWDPNSYLNLWVGNDVSGSGILGYAHFPGTGIAADDGVFLNAQSFSNNPCYTIPAYNLGRTGTHEIGHYFGLLHIWGDDNNCTGDDFRNLSGSDIGSTCNLPATLANPPGQGNTAADIGDTPNQLVATTNCPSGAVTDGCATTLPGKMYQDYMDYTADACYSMFTKQQVNRMQWVLDNCRASLKTSLGLTPPVGAPALDAGLFSVVNPGGTEIIGNTCVTYPTPVCANTVTPKVMVVNKGVSTLTSVTVSERLNANAVVSQTFVVNLPTLGSQVVTLAPITFTGGANTLKFWTSAPNGGADADATNDTLTKVYNFTGQVLPLVQGFETAPFPPTGWVVNNPNNDLTWVRVAPGSSSAASMAKDNWDDFNVGRFDDFISPVISTTGLDSVIITYDIAKKFFPGLPDRLDIMVSTNCGASFTSVYNAVDPALSTAGALTSGPYVTPGASDWVTRRLAIGGANLGTGQILIQFRNTTGYGNNIFLDNINITGFTFTNRDITPTAVLRPLTQECTPTIAPSITVRNSGLQPVTTFSVGYIVDNGAPSAGQTFTPATPLAPNASTTVTLTAANFAVGTHVIKLYTYNPVGASGTGDLFTANDTILKTFTVNQLFTTFKEDFETVTPPAMPAQITVVNPNGNNTWESFATGHASKNSAWINNYAFNVPGNFDDMKLRPINTNGVDSVILTFDVAHKNYPGLDDILSVVASTDCGNTYVGTSYSKPGVILQTAGSSTAAYARPGPNDWRTERVAVGGAFMSTGSLILAIRNTNGYGNNIYIDNINITRKFKRDLAVTSIIQPTDVVCSATVTPVVTVQNVGSEAVTAYTIGFSIDGVAQTPVTGTGVPLAPFATTTVTISTPASFTQAPHVFKVYTINPTSLSGSGDLNLLNDTLTKTVTRVASIAPPIAEGFEGTTFPPAGWAVVNPDNGVTWRRTTAAARTGIASAYVNNYNYAVNGQKDDLYTPQLTYTGVDSVSLSFDVAATTFSYPGTTTIPLDTLEVLMTKDCGSTFTTVYKKWGHDLQTVSDPNNAQPSEFFPSAPYQWRNESIDLTGLAAGNGPLQLVFRNTSNFENNIFLDNVNVTTRTLPARLKNEGFLVLPNPFKDQFTVWHYLQPTDLRYITVYNSAGQQVWRKDFSGDADKQVGVDLSNRAAGVYIVHLGYNDSNKNVSVRIVKL
jgi:hypothetical protein